MKLKWLLIGFGVLVASFGFLAVVVFIIPTNKIDGTVRILSDRKIVVYVVPYDANIRTMLDEHFFAAFDYDGAKYSYKTELSVSTDKEIVERWKTIDSLYRRFINEMQSNPTAKMQAVDSDGTYAISVPFGHYLAVVDAEGRMITNYDCEMYAFQHTRFEKIVGKTNSRYSRE